MSKTFSYTAKPALTSDRGRGTSTFDNGNSRGRGGAQTRGRANTQPRGRGNTQPRGRAKRSDTFPVGRGNILNRDVNMYQPPGNHTNLRPGNTGLDNDDQETDPSASRQPASIQDRTEMRDSYTVIRPNEVKRTAIKDKAKSEEDAYQAYKASKKLHSVSYVGTVGGDQFTQDDVRRKTQQQHNRRQFDMRQKSQQYKADQKARENEEYDKKKLEQRKKTDENERRITTREENIKEDHRRKNNAFLDRLEKQNRDAIGKKILSSTAAKSYEHDSEGGRTEYQSSPGGATSGWQDTEPAIHSGTDPLTQLIQAYPDYQPEILCQILDTCGQDVERAKELLQ